MKVKFKQLHPLAKLPKYAKEGDGAMDLTATEVKVLTHSFPYDDNLGFENGVECKTGLAMEIPEGYVGLLFPRSSISNTQLTLANCVGVIDSGYRGEVSFRFKYLRHGENPFKVGDRIGQLIIMPYPKIETEWAEELTETERGVGGYGSTGLN